MGICSKIKFKFKDGRYGSFSEAGAGVLGVGVSEKKNALSATILKHFETRRDQQHRESKTRLQEFRTSLQKQWIANPVSAYKVLILLAIKGVCA